MNLKEFKILKAILILLIIYTYSSLGADTNLVNTDFTGQNYFNIGLNKNLNIYNFYSNLKYSNSLGTYRFDIANTANSTILKINDINYKDENIFVLNIAKNIYKNFSLNLDNTILYSADSRPIGNNSLSDELILPGVSYQFSDISFVKFSTGYDFNKKMNIKTEGPTYAMELNVKNFEIVKDLNFQTKTKYRRTNFNNNRFYSHIYSNNILESNFDELNSFRAGLNYNDINLDYINFTDAGQSDFLYEQNNIKNLDSKAEIRYSPVSSIKLMGSLVYADNAKTRDFDNFNSLIKNSFYQRNSKIQRLSIAVNSVMEFSKAATVINADYDNNEEIFEAQPKNDSLPINEINDYINIQKFNNYTSSKLRLNIAEIMQFRHSDSLYVNLTASIYQYDTPVEGNNDDYDEAYSAVFASYKYRIDRNNNFKVIFELKNRHNAFLKAEKSAQSNSLKTIRLATEMEFRYDNLFCLNPKVDIVANYNVYDFKLNNITQNTYSFRQISYLDSAVYIINEHNCVNFNMLLRYSERGYLNWEDFSELPLKSNLEQMYKLMFYNNFVKYSFGIGIGYYGFDLNDLITVKSDRKSFIISPEAYIKYSFSQNGNIVFSGKYDFQNFDNLKREVVNAFLKCELNL